jgi:hypothetical protein
VRNLGPATALGAEVELSPDVALAGARVCVVVPGVEACLDEAGYAPLDVTGRVPVGDLVRGERARVRLRGEVAADAAGTVTLAVSVDAQTADPVVANDLASVVSMVTARADLVASLNGPLEQLVGSQAVYTARVRNPGPSVAVGVVATLIPADELTGVEVCVLTATEDCTDDAAYALLDGSGQVPFGHLSVGENGRVRVRGLLDATTPLGAQLTSAVHASAVTPSGRIGTATANRTTTAAGLAPAAAADAFTMLAGDTATEDVLVDNGAGPDVLGVPAAQVASFGGGDLGGTVADNPAGTTVGLAGGQLTLAADGTLTLVAPTAAGVHAFDYRLSNAAGTSDATVTITIDQAPTATDDGPAAASAPGDAWHTAFETELDSDSHATPPVLANDLLGHPAGAVVSFGGGALGGTVTDTEAGQTATAGGHAVTVHDDGQVVYQPAAGFTGEFTFTYRLANSVGFSDATATIAVGERPVASADTYPASLVGNLRIDTATATPYSTLGNDGGDQLSAALVPGSATNGTAAVAADGTFVFEPAAGFRGGNASFAYTVSNGFGTSAPATVTVPVSTSVIWFVDNTAPSCTDIAAGCGRLSTPLSTLAALHAANDGTGNRPADGHHIFVAESATAYTGGLTLRTGQRLIGQDATASLTALTGLTPPTHSPPLPAMQPGNATRTTLTNPAGNAVTLAAGNRLHGLTLGNATTALAGSAVGTLTIDDTRIDTNGRALDLANGTVTATLTQTTSTGGTNNLRLVGLAGTLQLGTGALSGSTAEGILIDGGTATTTYTGTLTNTANRSVSITNKTGGTTTLTGPITDTAAGIHLTNNPGATTTFTGGLALTTGANPALTATGGGTITATQNNTSTVNTLTTTTATALRVENTTIGAAGLTFRAINAGTPASGPTNGIVLTTTGTAAGLTVTGTGGTCTSAATCTGGAIQSTTGAGIALANTNAVSLTRMHVSGPADDGISGNTVTGFLLASSHVANNGNAVSEAGLDFTNLLGTAAVTGSTITGSADDNIVVRNTTGNLALTVSGNTISHNGTNGNDGLLATAANAGTVTLTVENNTFAANKGDHVQATVSNQANLTATILNNTMTGGHPLALGQGITLGTGLSHTGTMTYDIATNTITGNGTPRSGPIATAITVIGSGHTGSLAQGHVRNNTIGTAGQALSCSEQGHAIAVDAASRTTHTSAITNNIIRRCFDRGIFVNAVDGTGVRVNLTITGNDVGDFASGAVVPPREALYVNVGALSSNQYGLPDDHVVCATIGGATTALRNSLSGGADKTADLRLRMRFSTRMNLPGYTGAFDNGSSAVETYLGGRNTAGSSLATTSATNPTHGYHNFTDAPSCPTPP